MSTHVTTHVAPSGDLVTVKELIGWNQYNVTVAGDSYEVCLDEAKGGWFTEVGGVEEGPFTTADNLISTLFLSEDV